MSLHSKCVFGLCSESSKHSDHHSLLDTRTRERFQANNGMNLSSSLGRRPGPGDMTVCVGEGKSSGSSGFHPEGGGARHPQWVTLSHHFVSTVNIHSPLISLEFQTLCFSRLHFPALPALAPSPETWVTDASHQHAWFSSFWWDIHNCNPAALPPLFWACAAAPVMLAGVSSLFLDIFYWCCEHIFWL